MKKLSIFAVALAAMAFTACGGGQKTTPEAEATDSVKSFEQEQVEAKIKIELDSLAAQISNLKKLPILQAGENGIQLTEQEKQVKPDYLIDPATAENATTLAEKYRMISALSVDKNIAALYDMPTDDYDAAIQKLAADINDPSFKVLDNAADIHEGSQLLYDTMNENGRINYFWQIVSASLVEQLFVITQNTDKFLSAFDDDAADKVTYRIILLNDAITRLSEYDTEFIPVAKTAEALAPLNAISVEQLKAQLEETKENIAAARNELIK